MVRVGPGLVIVLPVKLKPPPNNAPPVMLPVALIIPPVNKLAPVTFPLELTVPEFNDVNVPTSVIVV